MKTTEQVMDLIEDYYNARREYEDSTSRYTDIQLNIKRNAVYAEIVEALDELHDVIDRSNEAQYETTQTKEK